MAKSKIHVMLGQGVLDGPCTITYLTANADPREGWYSAAFTSALWRSDTNALVAPWSPLSSNNWVDGAAHPDLGVSCGVDLTFARDVVELEAANTHCILKQTGAGVLRAGVPAPYTHRWDKAGADLYNHLSGDVVAARAALLAALPANTVEIGSITIAIGYIEASVYGTWTNGVTNLKADLETLISNLRSDLAAITGQTASAIPVLLWRLHNGTKVSLGGAYVDEAVDAVRNALAAVQTAGTLVRVVDVDDAPLRADYVLQTPAGAVDAGELLARGYARLTDTSVPVTESGGIPLFVWDGDSNVAGTAPALFLGTFFNGDPTLTQDYTDKVWIWNHTTGELEVYDPTVNSNSGPDSPTWNDSGKWGPEASFVAKMLELHPGGFVIYKLGVNGCSVGVNGVGNPIALKRFQNLADSTWPAFEDGFNACKRAVAEVTGKVPHTRLIVVYRGPNDTEAGLAEDFADDLREHIANLRELCATDTHADDVTPVALIKPKDIPGNSWPAEGLVAVRAAVVTVAADEGNFLVDVDETAYRDDLIHDSAEGQIDIGRAVVAALPAWYDSGAAGG